MSGTPCPRCRRRTVDGLLCQGCVGVFERAVGDLARLRADLAVVVAKLDEVSRAVVHRPSRVDVLDEAPRWDDRPVVPAALRSLHGDVALASHGVPVNLDAVDLARKVDAALARWVVALQPVVPAPYGPTCDVRRLAGPTCARVCDHPSCAHVRVWTGPWCMHGSCAQIRERKVPPAVVLLLSATEALRRHPEARDCVDELERLARAVEGVVDRRDADVYCGPCDAPDVSVTLVDGVVTVATDRVCGVDLYARFGDDVVDCPACGYRYRIAERRPWLLEQCREVWERPAAIARALAALDLDLTAERLDQWISRDKRRHRRCWPGEPCTHIVPVGLDSDAVDEEGRPLGRALYRVGDVLDRVEELRAAKAARESVEAH